MSEIRANGAAVQEKSHKASRYASEPERFVVHSFKATLRSDHGVRSIAFDAGTWSCSCDFFKANRTCSHVLALDQVLGQQAQLTLE